MDDENFPHDDEFFITIEDSENDEDDREDEPVSPSFTPSGDRNACRPEDFPLHQLIGSPDSYFKGTKQLGVPRSKKGVDFFMFRLPNVYLGRNIKIILRSASLTNHFQMLLYDDQGNQIQRAQLEHTDPTGLFLMIPGVYGFNVQSPDFEQQYYLKVESEEYNASYRLYAATGSMDSSSFAKILRTAVEIIGLDADQKTTKTREQAIHELHEKQLKALPEEDCYTGSLAVDQLLYKISVGESLSYQEEIYISIMANAFDYNEAAKKADFLNVSNQINELLTENGILLTAGQKLTIQIYANGVFKVAGLANASEKLKVEWLLEEKMKDELYNLYIRGAPWLACASKETYDVALGIQFIERFLYQATKGIVRFEKLSLDKNNKIMGLPKKLNVSVNSMNYENVFYEGLRDMIVQGKNFEKKYGKENLPIFYCKLLYCDGEISIGTME